MSFIHNHDFSIRFISPALKKGVLIIRKGCPDDEGVFKQIFEDMEAGKIFEDEGNLGSQPAQETILF